MANKQGYKVVSIPLDNAKTDQFYGYKGNVISVLAMNGKDASIKLNSKGEDSINMMLIKSVKAEFSGFYLTSSAQTNKTLVLGIGNEYVLHKSGFVGVFRYSELDADGSANTFETDQDIDTLPTVTLTTEKIPAHLDSGVIKRILFYMNPTNAVTYTLMLWRKAVADNVTSYSNLLYRSDSGMAKGTIYDKEVEIPFTLDAEGVIYASVDWSAACGDTPGFVVVIGEYYE